MLSLFDGLTAWVKAEKDSIGKVLAERMNILKLLYPFIALPPSSVTLTELQKLYEDVSQMIANSTLLGVAITGVDMFWRRVVGSFKDKAFCANTGLVTVVIRIITSLFEKSEQSKALVERYELRNLMKHLKNDSHIIVQQLAQKLLVLMS